MNAVNAYLNSNDETGLISLGISHLLRVESNQALYEIQSFIEEHKGEYIFMALSYDLKEELAGIPSNNLDSHNFPKAFLWVSETVAEVANGKINFLKGSCDHELIHGFLRKQDINQQLKLKLKERTSKSDYLEHVRQI